MKRLIVIAALAAATPALAQGTLAERVACTRDVIRVCHPTIADALDHSRIIKCLVDHKAKLGKPCRAVLAAHHL
jgi:hypothetical protein